MAGLLIVANGGVAPVTVGANTVAAHSVAKITLAAGDADGFLTAGCVVAALAAHGPQKVQEAAFLLHRNPGAI